MTERDIKHNRTNEISDLPDGIDEFITDLFPQIFQSLMSVKSLRDLLISNCSILDPDSNSVNFTAELSQNNFNIYVSYFAIGKEDKAFKMWANQGRWKNQDILQHRFCIVDSSNGYFAKLSNNRRKSISSSKLIQNIAIDHTNDYDACEAGVDAASLIQSMAGSQAQLLDD